MLPLVISENFFPLYIMLWKNNTTYIFHCTHSIVRYKYMVKLTERIVNSKQILVKWNSFLWDTEPFLYHFFCILSDRLPTIYSLFDLIAALFLIQELSIRSCHYSIKVRWNFLGFFKFKELYVIFIVLAKDLEEV